MRPSPIAAPALAILLTLTGGIHAATQTFSYTGAEQGFVVPAGITSITVAASGAQGGTALSASPVPGGNGGSVTATVDVAPGDSLAVRVGGAGASTNTSNGGAGGFNGGASGGAAGGGPLGGGGGGGASSVLQGSTMLVASGGGGGSGAGSANPASGGAGGGLIGGNGGNGTAPNADGGAGGNTTLATGGAGGAAGGSGTAGSPGVLGAGGTGGNGNGVSGIGGGGSGGGYFGGGGGGGSSYAIGTATDVSMTQGTRSGAGQVVLTWQVTSLTVSTDAELRAAITTIDDGGTITFANDITLAGDLPAVQKSITIDGAGHALDGAGTYRGLFFAAWTPGTATFIPIAATVENLTIQNAKARGGNGGGRGGGGAGLGGALFIADLASVELDDVILSGNAATGGGTLNTYVAGGAGGGMGGIGGDGSFGGGGGLGIGANGGNGVDANGSPGIATGALPGANGSGSGGANGGGGGSTGGGGVGGSGANGGFGGGGGSYYTGLGGFGGGGAGGGTDAGNGGFGGGGGGAQFSGTGGLGGFGGGNGYLANGGGGGGAGMGGAIFVMQGGSLVISGPLTIDGSAVTAGSGVNGGTNGSAFGSGIFIQGGNFITLSPAVGETQTINDVIADERASGGGGTVAVELDGAGTLVLAGANTFSKGVGVTGRLLLMNTSGSATGNGGVSIKPTGWIGGSGSSASNTVLEGTLSTDNGQLTLASLTWIVGGKLTAALGSTAQSTIITGALAKYGTGTRTIALTDGGVTPGTTYTLLTFGSVTGLSASDFTVTGITGTLTLEANALKFTVPATPIPPTYGVSMSLAKGKDRATFTITNTGSTTTGFRLSSINKIINHHHGPKPPDGKPAFRITYLLNGVGATKAIKAGTALATIPAGGTATVVVKVRNLRSLRTKRIVQGTLTATSQVSPGKSASKTVKFVFKPDGT